MFRKHFQVDLPMDMDGQVALSMGVVGQIQPTMSLAFALSMSHNEPEGLHVSTPLLMSQVPTPAPIVAVDPPKAVALQQQGNGGGTTTNAMLGAKSTLAPGAIASITLLAACALVVAGLLIYRRRRMRQSPAAALSTLGETDVTGSEA
jgi:hypothetical protein